MTFENNMRIFVTGATGFLGYSLVKMLRQKAYDVTAIGRNQSKAAQLEALGAKFVYLDLDDQKATQSALKGHDGVIHCAALSSPWGKYEDFLQANVDNTENLLKASMENSITRFIHISTPSIYFRFQHQYGLSEKDALPLKKVNHYATTKYLAEEKVNEAASRGLETVILRPRGIFGPGDTAIMPRIIRAGSLGALPIFTNKPIMIDITYVDNVSQAAILAMENAGDAVGQVFNISNGEPVDFAPFLSKVFAKIKTPLNLKYIPFPAGYAIASVLEAVHSLPWVKKEPALTKYLVGLFAFSQTLNIEKAKNLLNYQPSISVNEGVDRFAKWWLNNKTH